jgi:hypothetical protein
MQHDDTVQQQTEDQVRPAAVLDLESFYAIKDALHAGAALASTLTEMGIASSDDMALVCSITESKSDIALARLKQAEADAKTKTLTKSTTEVSS